MIGGGLFEKGKFPFEIGVFPPPLLGFLVGTPLAAPCCN